jgi:predicted MFS family arabinose efflux permease
MPVRSRLLIWNTLLSRNRIYRRLWLAQTGSSLGDWFNQVALATTILAMTHSPTAIALVLLCRDLPQAGVSLVVGPLIDRSSKRTIMVASDAVRAGLCGLFIWGGSRHELWPFYLGAVGMGCAASLFDPARSAVIPVVVEVDDLTAASAWTVGTSGVLAMGGAILGGMVSAWASPTWAFLINALSYAWSASWIWSTRWNERPTKQPRSQGAQSYGREWAAGLRAVRRNQLLLALVATSAAFALMAGPYFVVIPVLGDLTYHMGGLGIGFLYLADGLAFLLSATLVGHLVGGSERMIRMWYGLGFLIESVFFVLLSYSAHLWIGMLALFVSQLGSGVVMTLASVIVQRSVPPGMQGRVFALSTSIDTSAKQLSLLVSGPAISLLGIPRTGLITGGLGCAAGVFWWLASGTTRSGVPAEEAVSEIRAEGSTETIKES